MCRKVSRDLDFIGSNPYFFAKITTIFANQSHFLFGGSVRENKHHQSSSNRPCSELLLFVEVSSLLVFCASSLAICSAATASGTR